jgi:hypothetical protein
MCLPMLPTLHSRIFVYLYYLTYKVIISVGPLLLCRFNIPAEDGQLTMRPISDVD